MIPLPSIIAYTVLLEVSLITSVGLVASDAISSIVFPEPAKEIQVAQVFVNETGWIEGKKNEYNYRLKTAVVDGRKKITRLTVTRGSITVWSYDRTIGWITMSSNHTDIQVLESIKKELEATI